MRYITIASVPSSAPLRERHSSHHHSKRCCPSSSHTHRLSRSGKNARTRTRLPSTTTRTKTTPSNYHSFVALLLVLSIHVGSAFVPKSPTNRINRRIRRDICAESTANLVQEAPTVLTKHPHFTCNNSIQKRFSLSPSIVSQWESLVPKPDLVGSLLGGLEGATAGHGRSSGTTRRGVLGVDVTVQYECRNAQEGARMLLEKTGMEPKEDTLSHLTSVLEYYHSFVCKCDDDNNIGKKQRCKARIVSSRGPIGTKCPRWHVDHVPVRLILSLVGPGCVYIGEEGNAENDVGKSANLAGAKVYVHREALNQLDMDDTRKANRIIVPNESGVVRSGPGDAVILMGKEWETPKICEAAAHRSPDLAPFEARVLITVDVVPDEY